MNHKDMTSVIRSEIKASGVKARCRMLNVCGGKAIQVYTIKHGIEFTDDEQQKIKSIAIDRGLTCVRRIPIDFDRNTDPRLFEFYL